MGRVNGLNGFTRGQLDATLFMIGQSVGVGTADGIRALLGGKLAIVRLVWDTWLKLKLGTGIRTAADFRSAICKTGIKISGKNSLLLDSQLFTVSSKEVEVELVRVLPRELGFKNGAKYSEVCARAKEFGFDKCPNEVGPQLCLQYLGQLKDLERFIVAMEPIVDSAGAPFLFSLECENKTRWFFYQSGGADRFCTADTQFLFVRRKVI
jgi:hypothetical protein